MLIAVFITEMVILKWSLLNSVKIADLVFYLFDYVPPLCPRGSVSVHKHAKKKLANIQSS